MLHFDILSQDIAVEIKHGTASKGAYPEDWGNNVLELWAGLSETFCELEKKRYSDHF